MLPNALASLDNSAEKVASLSEKSVASPKVVYDFGELMDPNHGPRRVKGEYFSLNPKHKRPTLAPEELDSMKADAQNWFNAFFESTGKSEFFDILVETSSLASAYLNPFVPLGSSEMKLLNYWYLWEWIIDDTLESAVASRVPVKTLNSGMMQLMDVLENNATVYTEVANFSDFRRLFYALVDLNRRCRELIPGWEKTRQPFCKYLRQILEATRWAAVRPIDHKYSEDMFQYYRQLMGYADLAVETVWIFVGNLLPDEILRAPSFKRLLDLLNSLTGNINDLVGLRKEFENAHFENNIIFKVFQKGIPVDEAAQSVLCKIKNDHADYLLLRQSVLEEFDHHPDLAKYVDVTDSFLYGNNQGYAQSRRHFGIGFVKLIP